MAGSEDLVPQGLPQGQRQATEAAMVQAGAPLSSAGVAPATARPAPAAAPAPAHGFDPLLAMAPTPPNEAPPPALTVEDRMRPMLGSPNPVVREMAARFLERRSSG